MRDHQHGHVNNWDCVRGAQLPCHRGKADLDGVVIVEDEIDHPHEIEGHREQPKERTYSYREKRKDRKQPGCQVPVSSERGEASDGQIRADDAWKLRFFCL